MMEILKIGYSTIRNYEKAGILTPGEMTKRKKLYLKKDIENIRESLRKDKYKRRSKY